MKLGSPTTLTIKLNKEKTEFLFLLTFPGRQQPVEFEMKTDGAMVLMGALQSLQARHKVSIPRVIRPKGKPTLRVVTDDD